MFDPKKIKKDFPILNQLVNGLPLCYLDNAATSQKPQVVIEAISSYYLHDNANVHRGIHYLSDQASQAWDQARLTVANFFGCLPEELIVTRNATEAINGVAYGWALDHLKAGDVILTTLMEHHANIVPWQEMCHRIGAKLEFIKVTDQGTLDISDLESKLKNDRIKLVTLVHVSNTLGTVNPVEQIVKLVKKQKSQIKILIDGAQSAPHLKIDFNKLDVDFFVFSGHKMLAPMGVGALLVKKELLENQEMKPWLFGGGMIDSVTPQKTEFNQDLSERFTAGTPDVASLVGLASACNYLNVLGMDNVQKHDQELVEYALKRLAKLSEVEVVGPKTNRLGSVAFIYQGVHAHDVAQILDSVGVAVRSGHHCCMPLHLQFGWQATVRASFQVYSTQEDIDQLIVGLNKVKKVFS